MNMNRILSISQFFIGLSAVLGGLVLILTNGMGMPPAWLAGTPISSYLIPGIILFVVVGGSYILSAAAVWNKHPLAPEASATAGFAMLIWIFVELSVIRESSWLQTFYFGFGLLTLTLTMLDLRRQLRAALRNH